MKCWHCKSDLIWGGDHDIEDLDTDGDGILTNLSCSNEKCNTQVEVYHYFPLDDGKDDYQFVGGKIN